MVLFDVNRVCPSLNAVSMKNTSIAPNHELDDQTNSDSKLGNKSEMWNQSLFLLAIN